MDRFLGVFVFAFTEMGVLHVSLSINQVFRWPVFIFVGVPGSEVIVQSDWVFDTRFFHGTLELLEPGVPVFLFMGEDECRAWTIKRGTKAPQAAGKIHTDFERGFIRAEVVNFDDLMACGSMNAAKEKGLVRSEGKEYVMKDGDIVLFRFNV